MAAMETRHQILGNRSNHGGPTDHLVCCETVHEVDWARCENATGPIAKAAHGCMATRWRRHDSRRQRQQVAPQRRGKEVQVLQHGSIPRHCHHAAVPHHRRASAGRAFPHGHREGRRAFRVRPGEGLRHQRVEEAIQATRTHRRDPLEGWTVLRRRVPQLVAVRLMDAGSRRPGCLETRDSLVTTKPEILNQLV